MLAGNIAREADDKPFLINVPDAMIDIGTGGRFYYNGKHLGAVEIIYSFGLMNIKNHSNLNVYNNVIQNMFRQCLTFSINFS